MRAISRTPSCASASPKTGTWSLATLPLAAVQAAIAIYVYAAIREPRVEPRAIIHIEPLIVFGMIAPPSCERRSHGRRKRRIAAGQREARSPGGGSGVRGELLFLLCSAMTASFLGEQSSPFRARRDSLGSLGLARKYLIGFLIVFSCRWCEPSTPGRSSTRSWQ